MLLLGVHYLGRRLCAWNAEGFLYGLSCFPGPIPKQVSDSTF